MNAQLMLLLELQDLHLQRTSLLEEPGYGQVEANTFQLDPKVAVDALDKKIVELTEGLEPAIRKRCERGFPTLGRMVVPVIEGICYGCFVAIPTSRAADGRGKLETCESCGRFIYVLT